MISIQQRMKWIPGILVLMVALFGISGTSDFASDIKLEGTVVSVNNGDTTQVKSARVFLTGVPSQMGYTADKDRRLMDQVNQTFTPHILPVAVEEEVSFRNSDPSNHNVRLVRDGSNNVLMNKMTYPGQSVSYTFKKEGLIHVRCDIHPNMHALIPVLDAPFLLKKTRSDGKFSFSLPDTLSGQSFTIRAWTEQFGWSNQQVVKPKKTGKSRSIELLF